MVFLDFGISFVIIIWEELLRNGFYMVLLFKQTASFILLYDFSGPVYVEMYITIAEKISYC